MKTQNRFKSKVLWASLISAFILIAQSIDVIPVDNVDALTNAGQLILGVLVTIGILHDPTIKS
ncbi:MAG TPA: holin [Clostridiales bacterium]|nr:MAG: hypothetical protein A2Y18_07225 [Clostridiales bacterium GWD2_32_19]HCC08195.1 holin [Clostridiales bacterium]